MSASEKFDDIAASSALALARLLASNGDNLLKIVSVLAESQYERADGLSFQARGAFR
jgi:hypothetical protein